MALGNPLPLLLSTVGDYEIARSLRFNSADTTSLTRTPSSNGNKRTWTFSGWVKRSKLGAIQTFFSAGSDNPDVIIKFTPDDEFEVSRYGGSYQNQVTSAQKFRDASGWYHLVAAVDTTQSTASNRVRMYVNGTEITSFTNSSYPSEDYEYPEINDTGFSNKIGRHGSTSQNFEGYLTELNFIDGTQLTPSSFGETNEDTGQWIPKKYAGSYGTNGFHLNFSDNSGTTATTLGKDSSSNGNNFTPNNFSVAAGVGNDSVIDTPTNNYPTLNSVDGYSTLSYEPSNGGLDYNISDTSAIPYSTIAIPTSGKWYAEFTATDIETAAFGFKPIDDFGLFSEGYLYAYHGKIWKNNSETQTVAAISDGDIIGVAVDRSAQTVQFSKNGTNIGNTEALVAGTEYKYWIARWASSGGNPQGSVNFGQRAFSHQPTGFVGLCTSELPTPTIKDGTKHFNTVLYTGTGTTDQAKTVGFQPDLLWIRKRNNADDNILTDGVIGAPKYLISNKTDAEATYAEGVKSLDANGFTLGSANNINQNTHTYVAWNWKESASAGFDIVSYAGTGSSRTVSHSLGVAPEMMIVKNRDDSENWIVYHAGIASDAQTDYIILNSTAAAGDDTWLNDTAPTSSQWEYSGGGNSYNASGDDYIAYLFASVKGYSKINSYLGNGNANGLFVYTGFKPAWVMTKRAIGGSSNWNIFDKKRPGYNVTNVRLFANITNAESDGSPTNNQVDLLSNGFKMRGNNADTNGSGDTYIYLAFAESPFKYANAR